MQLINTTIAKDLSYVKEDIENHNVNVNSAPWQRVTALHITCADGSLDIVKYLIFKKCKYKCKRS
jgi:ankyrin repeat protein